MKIPLGLQLYTVRDETQKDFAATLRRVAEMGYTSVEFAGYGNLSTLEIQTLLAETGLQALSTHVGLALLEQNLEQAIDTCVALSCPFLILPWLAPELRSAEAFRTLAPRLNAFGQRCHDKGITFGYHNHNFEFVQSDGRYLLDQLLDETDPSLVLLELDVYWAAYAGVDPVAYMKQHAGRLALVHLKDMTPAPESAFTEVGDGTLDMKTICAVAQQCGAQGLLVENDRPRIPSLESAKRSLENLQHIIK